MYTICRNGARKRAKIATVNDVMARRLRFFFTIRERRAAWLAGIVIAAIWLLLNKETRPTAIADCRLQIASGSCQCDRCATDAQKARYSSSDIVLDVGAGLPRPRARKPRPYIGGCQI